MSLQGLVLFLFTFLQATCPVRTLVGDVARTALVIGRGVFGFPPTIACFGSLSLSKCNVLEGYF